MTPEPTRDDNAASSDGRPGLRGSRRTRRLLRDLHQRTGELELLISGAVALLLALVPAQVDRIYYRASQQLVGAAEVLTFFGFYYLKLILYILIVTFGIHLAVRAFWVALIGLDSVFPRGIRWNRLSNGPISKAYFRRILPSTRELIVYADGVASVTFAAGFSLVSVFLVSVIGAGAVGLFVVLAAAVLPFDIPVGAVFAWLAISLAILATAPMIIDQFFGRFLVDVPGREWARRLLARLVRVSATMMGFRLFGPVQLTLSSQLGNRAYTAGVMTVITLVLGFFLSWDVLSRSGGGVIATSPWQPIQVGAAGVNPRHYEDRESPEPRRRLIPTIPSEVVDAETFWLRIFVPANPEMDDPALARRCPDAEPLASVGLNRGRQRSFAPADSVAPRIQRVLECTAELWQVSVDGRPVSDPVFYDQAEAGLRGLAWYFDLRTIPTGRHLVEVRRTPGVDEDPEWSEEEREEAAGELPMVFRIPFWN